jgi:hypothetical protein
VITCYFPNPGYSASIRPHQPQGADPKQLIMDLVYTKLAGTWPDIVTPMRLRYDPAPPAVFYTSVQFPSMHLTIPVEIAS